VAAAQALGEYGTEEDADKALKELLDLSKIKKYGVYVPTMALNAIGAMGERAREAKDELANLPERIPGTPGRASGYVGRLLKELNNRFQ
jgi:hypothetical protein